MTNGAGGGKHGQTHGPKVAPENAKVTEAKKTTAAAGTARGSGKASSSLKA